MRSGVNRNSQLSPNYKNEGLATTTLTGNWVFAKNDPATFNTSAGTRVPVPYDDKYLVPDKLPKMKKERYSRTGKVGLDIDDDNKAILKAAKAKRTELSANQLTRLSRTKDFATYFSRKSRQLADL